MRTLSVIILLVIFAALQLLFFLRGQKKFVKLLPIIVSAIGEMIGMVIYYGAYIPYLMKMNSQNVLSENQYIALTICVLFAPCFVGSMLGFVLAKFWKNKKIIYFLPFVLAIVLYMVMLLLGFGMISTTKLIWLLLFGVSGFLLSMGKVWGSIFGMIPGIVFMWMSTNYTGQVINIEFPLGLIIVGFYVGCSVGIYQRKRRL